MMNHLEPCQLGFFTYYAYCRDGMYICVHVMQLIETIAFGVQIFQIFSCTVRLSVGVNVQELPVNPLYVH